MSRKYAVIYEEGPTSVGAYVPDLPACGGVEETMEEVEQLFREAIELYIAGMIEARRNDPGTNDSLPVLEATVPQA